MPGNENIPAMQYLLDTSTLSQAFGAFNPVIFFSFWERFDALVQAGRVASVRLVRLELENSSKPAVSMSPVHLENFNRNFFSDPTEREQQIVRDMINDPAVSSAANRWRSKLERGTEDADPWLIARARASMLSITVVTEESQDTAKTDRLPAVCRQFGIDCINLDEMIFRLGWRF